MQPFCIVQDYDGAPDAFWALLFDPEYNRAYFGSVGIELELEREERQGDKLQRVVRYRSRKPVLALMRPFFPEGFGYREYATYDLSARRCEYRIEPSAFGQRTDIRATLSIEALSPTRFRRTYAGSVTIHVPVLGGRLEAESIRSMAQSQETAADITRVWLQGRPNAVHGTYAAE